MVEITGLLAAVNLDRFNAAFGIGAAGYSEGMVCVMPDRSANAEVAVSTRRHLQSAGTRSAQSDRLSPGSCGEGSAFSRRRPERVVNTFARGAVRQVSGARARQPGRRARS